MKQLIARSLALGTWMGLLLLGFTPVTHPQEMPKQQPPGQKMNVSSKELKAFVKAYVEIKKIRLAHESFLKDVRDPKEGERIQQEANVKIEKTLEKNGLNTEAYNRILKVVNADDELRRKALDLIDEERKKS
jgi:hypothetical protein